MAPDEKQRFDQIDAEIKALAAQVAGVLSALSDLAAAVAANQKAISDTHAVAINAEHMAESARKILTEAYPGAQP